MFKIIENEDVLLDEVTIHIKNYYPTRDLFEFYIKTDLIEETWLPSDAEGLHVFNDD